VGDAVGPIGSNTVEKIWHAPFDGNLATATTGWGIYWNPSSSADWKAGPLDFGVAGSITGLLPVANGGWATSSTPYGTAGYCFTSNGGSTPPSWQVCPGGVDGGGGGGALTVGGGGGSFTADVTGSISGTNIPTTLAAIQGVTLLASGGHAPTSGQVLGYNGVDWLPVPNSGCASIGTLAQDVTASTPATCGGSANAVVAGIGTGLSNVPVHAGTLTWDTSTTPYLFYGGTNAFQIQGFGDIDLFPSGNAIISAGGVIDLETAGTIREQVNSTNVQFNVNTLEWASAVSAPNLTQLPTSSGPGHTITISGQSTSGALQSGGVVAIIGGGNGAGGIPGDVQLQSVTTGNALGRTDSTGAKWVTDNGVRRHLNVLSSSYQILTSDHVVEMTGTGAQVDTLPHTPTVGDEYVVCCRISAISGSCTLAAGSGQSINGATSLLLAAPTFITCETVLAVSSTQFVTIAEVLK
jgi:hypothetical protein